MRKLQLVLIHMLCAAVAALVVVLVIKALV